MTRYDTSSQSATARSRRWTGVVGTILLLLAAVYYLSVFFRDGGSTFDSAASFSLALSLFLILLTLVPLSLALGNHPHPSSIEVTEEDLALSFSGGRTYRRSWESGPVDTAFDTRDGDPGKRRPHGLEATVWVTMPGRDPGSTAVRLAQLNVSGHAFDEIRRRMQGAGYREIEEARRRIGTYYRYEKRPPVPAD